jgi:hypothetical protein
MSDNRPNLANVLLNYQVREDKMITWRPSGLHKLPSNISVEVTKTEGRLLDELTQERGLIGLYRLDSITKTARAEAERRFPNNALPDKLNFPKNDKERVAAWQDQDNHRDAFRHAYGSALMAQKFGAQWTAKFTSAHEGIPNNPANREAMDLYNNTIGIKIGAANPKASAKELATLVEQAVNQGKTIVIDSGGNIEWSDRVGRGKHGLTSPDVYDLTLKTPANVSTQSASNNAPTSDHTVATAAAVQDTQRSSAQAVSPNVAKMQQDPMYSQVIAAMNTKGLDSDVLAPKVFADAVNARLTEVKSVEVGKQIIDSNGNADRIIFAFDGTKGPIGLNHSRTSENEARTTSAQVAANSVEQSQVQLATQPEQQERKPISRTA